MDQFFIEQSSIRRKFLDKTANLLFVNHYDTVKKYEFFVKERLRILLSEKIDENWLKIVEKKIVELGVAIASIRNETIDIMNNIFNAYDLSFPVGILKVDGVIENMLRIKKSIDVDLEKLNFILTNRECIKYEDINSNEFVDIFLLRQNFNLDEIKFQKEEVSDAKYVSLEEFLDLMDNDKLLPHKIEYMVLKEYLNK